MAALVVSLSLFGAAGASAQPDARQSALDATLRQFDAWAAGAGVVIDAGAECYTLPGEASGPVSVWCGPAVWPGHATSEWARYDTTASGAALAVPANRPVEATLHGVASLAAPNGDTVTVVGGYSSDPAFVIQRASRPPPADPTKTRGLTLGVGVAALVVAAGVVAASAIARRRRGPLGIPRGGRRQADQRWAALLATATAPGMPSAGHPVAVVAGLAPSQDVLTPEPQLPGLADPELAVVDLPQTPTAAKPPATPAPPDIAPQLPAATRWTPPAPVPALGPSVDVLGPVEVTGWAGAPRRRVVVELAAFLALHPRRTWSNEDLRAAMWPLGEDGSRKEVSDHTLRSYASYLRAALGEEHFPLGTAGGYQLAGVSTDWSRFCDLVDLPGPDRMDALAQALSLVRGAPFADAAPYTFGWAWGSEMLVSSMEGGIVRVAVELGRLALAAGEPDQAAWAAAQALGAVPVDGALHELRLRAAAARGNRAEMERAWRDAGAALGEDERDTTLGDLYRSLRP